MSYYAHIQQSKPSSWRWLPFNHISVVGGCTCVWHPLKMMAVTVVRITFPRTCRCRKKQIEAGIWAVCHTDTWASGSVWWLFMLRCRTSDMRGGKVGSISTCVCYKLVTMPGVIRFEKEFHQNEASLSCRMTLLTQTLHDRTGQICIAAKNDKQWALFVGAKASPSSLLLCVVLWRESPFTGMMMIDIIGSQIFRSSLHTSWSLTSGISEMNDLSLFQTGEVILLLCSRESESREGGGEKKWYGGNAA